MFNESANHIAFILTIGIPIIVVSLIAFLIGRKQNFQQK